MENQWIKTREQLPPEGETVETKIHDHSGARNITTLKRQGALWYFSDGSMYAYYTPTHWRRSQAQGDGKKGE